MNLKKSSNTKITISQKCVNIFVPNFAHLFTRQLCKSVLLCAVFTRHTPNWFFHRWKLMTSLMLYAVDYSQSNIDGDVAPRRQILTECSKIKQVYEVLCAKQTRKIWCDNIYALHRYRNFCVGTFYSDSPCIRCKIINDLLIDMSFGTRDDPGRVSYEIICADDCHKSAVRLPFILLWLCVGKKQKIF